VCAGKVCFLVAITMVPVRAESSEWAEAIQQGRDLEAGSRFPEAETAFQRALQLAGGLPDSVQKQTTALYDLAIVEEDLGKPDRAAGLFNRAISLLRRVVAESDPYLQDIQIELASLYFVSGQVSIGETLLRQTMAAQFRAGESSSLEASMAWDMLGGLYIHQNQLAAAQDAVQRAVRILESQPSAVAPMVSARIDLANVLNKRGQHRKALVQAELAEDIAKKAPQVQPLVRCEILATLASLYVENGRSEAADEASREAISLAERVYGPNHFSCGWLWRARAYLLRKLNRKAEAKVAEQRGRAILGDSSLQRLGDTVPINGLLRIR
jgi:tetratricopeptide (TPR) repeat protein